jgi:hypothetical protein
VSIDQHGRRLEIGEEVGHQCGSDAARFSHIRGKPVCHRQIEFVVELVDAAIE